MRALLLLLILASASQPSAVASEARKVLAGGWKPIENVNDPHVVEIAKFAVSEHNKEAKAALVLIKVLSGESQVVAGVNYRLVVETKSGAADVADYEAVVWEKAWMNFRQLTSFKPVN